MRATMPAQIIPCDFLILNFLNFPIYVESLNSDIHLVCWALLREMICEAAPDGKDEGEANLFVQTNILIEEVDI